MNWCWRWWRRIRYIMSNTMTRLQFWLIDLQKEWAKIGTIVNQENLFYLLVFCFVCVFVLFVVRAARKKRWLIFCKCSDKWLNMKNERKEIKKKNTKSSKWNERMDESKSIFNEREKKWQWHLNNYLISDRCLDLNRCFVCSSPRIFRICWLLKVLRNWIFQLTD